MFKEEDAYKTREAKTAAINMLLDMMCESDMPRERKLPLEIMRAQKRTGDVLVQFCEKYVISKEDDAVLAGTREKALEYLSLVEVGIRQFMETVKLPGE